MNLYKITVKPVSSWCSPLQSDTFFGAFCWSYLYEYGEDALRVLIQNCKNGKPDIIFSNAFPSGRLPAPVNIREFVKEKEQPTTKRERYEKYINDKKKMSMILLSDFNKLINGDEGILRQNDHVQEPEQKLSMEWRNMVSRQTDRVENINGESSLFEVEQYFSQSAFDIFIYSSFEKRILRTVLQKMFYYGIGAQRSVGKGAFQMIGDVELFSGFEIPADSNAFVALSNFIPQRNDPTEGFYKAFVKYPKVSLTSNAEDSPFKKPIIFIQAGSIFRDCPVREFYGSCIENIALREGCISDEIIIGAYTIAVPCRLEGQWE